MTFPRAFTVLAVGVASLTASLAFSGSASAGSSAGTEGGHAVTLAGLSDPIDQQTRAAVRLVGANRPGPADHGVGPAELCSGTFISGTTVLTARHCLRDDATGKAWGYLDIIPAAAKLVDPATAAIARCRVPGRTAEFLPGSAYGADYGVIDVSRCAARWQQVPVTSVPLEHSGGLRVGQASSTIGYPGDRSGTDTTAPLLWRIDRPVSALGQFSSGGQFAETHGGVAGGFSGAGLLTQSAAGSWRVVGVLVENRNTVETVFDEGRVVDRNARYLRITGDVAAQLHRWTTPN